jgi:hypothetical protein
VGRTETVQRTVQYAKTRGVLISHDRLESPRRMHGTSFSTVASRFFSKNQNMAFFLLLLWAGGTTHAFLVLHRFALAALSGIG